MKKNMVKLTTEKEARIAAKKSTIAALEFEIESNRRLSEISKSQFKSKTFLHRNYTNTNALCLKFQRKELCYGCPVFKTTLQVMCCDTPCEYMMTSKNNRDYENFVDAAKDMVDFLTNILKKME